MALLTKQISLCFGEGINSEDLAFSRNGDDLVVKITNSSDQVTVENWYGHKKYELEEIHLAGGQVLNRSQIENHILEDQGTASADVIVGNDSDNLLSGLSGDDTISGAKGDDSLYGGEGNDTISAGEGNDQLFGGSGDDALIQEQIAGAAQRASVDVNTFEGGEGNDLLEGWTGADTYIFNKGDGQDVIQDTDYGSYTYTSGYSTRTRSQSFNKTDKLVFGEGIFNSDLRFTRNSNDLVISSKVNDDQITVKNWYSGDKYLIEEIHFFDSAVMNSTDVFARVLSDQVSDGDDVVLGDASSETIRGLAGNDVIEGNDGDDQLYGDEGNDQISGGKGQDTLHGNEGNDTLTGGFGNDQLFGGAGDDTLLEEEVSLQSTAASLESNTFEGGKGNDTLQGWVGSDTYIFNVGDGQDIIQDTDYGSYTAYRNRGYTAYTANRSFNKTDKLVFGEGILNEDLRFTRVDNNLIISLRNSSDQVTVENWFEHKKYQLEEITLVSGHIFTPSAVADRILEDQATYQDDSIVGNDSNNNLQGLEGNDQISGGKGQDTLHGNEGNDTLIGGFGNDQLFGGAGDDTLLEEEVSLQSTAASLESNTFEGGKGNDTLQGWVGSDTYIFNVGDGQDTIQDTDYGSYTAYRNRGYTAYTANRSFNKTDKLVFGEGVAKEDLWFSQEGQDLVIDLLGGTDQVTIEDWYQNKNQQIEEIHLADGSLLLNTQVEKLVSAMSSLAAPEDGEQLAPQEQQVIDNTIAVSWG